MLNRHEIIGNLGRTPELRYLPSGVAAVRVSVATTEYGTDKGTGQRTEDTTWHTVVAYDRLAELLGNYTRSGSRVYVAGPVHHRKYTKEDGTPVVAVEIKAREIVLLDRREASDSGPAAPNPSSKGPASPTRAPAPRAQSAAPAPATAGDMDDDIPF